MGKANYIVYIDAGINSLGWNCMSELINGGRISSKQSSFFSVEKQFQYVVREVLQKENI